MSVLEGPALLDGGMGTALLARGLGAGRLPEEWLRERPSEIAAVHAEHAGAGAAVLLTCTFNAATPRLEALLGPDGVEAACGIAARLARAAAGRALVAGALGPTGLMPPLGSGADPGTLAERYERPLAALGRAGADLLWLESQHDLDEAVAALRAARRTGLPAVVTFAFEEREGRLVARDGSDPRAWLAAVEAEGAAAAGVNCAFAGKGLATLAAERAGSTIPFVAKPSPGLPGTVLPPAAFAAALRPAVAAGARLVGGCCGATGDHLRALAAVLAAR